MTAFLIRLRFSPDLVRQVFHSELTSDVINCIPARFIAGIAVSSAWNIAGMIWVMIALLILGMVWIRPRITASRIWIPASMSAGRFSSMTVVIRGIMVLVMKSLIISMLSSHA